MLSHSTYLNFIRFIKYLLDGYNLRYVELEHILNSVFQGHDAARTGGTGALHLQFDDSVIKTHVDNVSSILLNCRTNPSIQQLLRSKQSQNKKKTLKNLDHGNGVIIIVVYFCTSESLHVRIDHRKATVEKVHYRSKNLWLHQLPIRVVIVLRYNDEVGTKKYTFDSLCPKN